jgi:hypothetical protein
MFSYCVTTARSQGGTMFAWKLDREGAIVLAFGWLVALVVTLT